MHGAPQPDYITIGDNYSDAYSGERKVPQAATEAKDPFSNGLEASSRHRGKQFVRSCPKKGQADVDIGVGVKFVSTNVCHTRLCHHVCLTFVLTFVLTTRVCCVCADR
jgi:hypothetical protein